MEKKYIYSFNLTSTLSVTTFSQRQFGKQFYKDCKQNENIVDVMEVKKRWPFSTGLHRLKVGIELNRASLSQTSSRGAKRSASYCPASGSLLHM
jgi:hypothetical protein